MLNFIHAPYHYLALITYVASASTGSEEGDEPFCPQTDSTDWRKADELIRMGWNRTSTAPPVYLLAADIEPEWRETADEVMRSAWEILGYYGPFHYLAVGTDTKAAEAVMYRFCELLNLPCEKCLSSENVEHIWKLVKTHPGDAFASTPTTPPVKIIVQSVNKREWEKRKIAIHEYVHIYQNSLVLNRQQTSPVWVKEGSAEFFAMYLSGEKGWHDFTAFMKTEMEVLQEMRKTHPDLRLADIETWEALKQIQETKRPNGAPLASLRYAKRLSTRISIPWVE
jgi:hypothetical protein